MIALLYGLPQSIPQQPTLFHFTLKDLIVLFAPRIDRMKKIVFALLFVTSLACSQKKIISDSFSSGEKLAELTDTTLEEVSGLVASINNPGYLWAHNDSERDPHIFLINDSLQIKLTCIIDGVNNRDWEDIAIGPGPIPGKNYLYIGEIGDNLARHQYKFIYRFEEPVLAPGITEVKIKQIDKITFQLPDQRKDTEALMIDPNTKNLFIISKREDPVWLYQLTYPYSITDTLTATKVLSLPLPQIVAGDIAFDGKEILLKNYKRIYYWNNPTGKPIEEALKEDFLIVPYVEEPQGESIAWKLDGSGFYTISELNPGKKSFLFFYKRK